MHSTESITSLDDDDDDDVRPASSRMPSAWFSGYRPFPPVINLYGNFSGVIDAVTTMKLCGADKNDFLYVVEIHHGLTPRGPLHFRPGLYLRNGTKTNAPILAAAGDEDREPLLMSTFSVKSLIMLPPPPDVEVKNPRDLVTEIMYAKKTSDGTVSFRFSIEVGLKMKSREEFEWRKLTGKDKTNTQHARFILVRPPPSSTSASSSYSTQEEIEVLADLTFCNVMSVNHLFVLELKGAAASGEMGDRWTLMVVVTALRLYWLRCYGKTNKAVVGIGQKLRGK
ncbi:hypothetical protein NEUTE1DRAFT_68315 [Neurospora tetrasperma FGSC 2508]|uniref:Uncharacterized protein n=1 Tax=Neurospora tetrasperma (strain FGSC 2508 / ATCC MYA-4615 / P0657) TaxID=510951 RepID=F8MVU6_NEUT8|nr:uncharacterized protein NEUTE1DRAFT_68315 [Neurospora tetrasperma FGSC 2508]EGO53994.1 hypothetical protein NEUTE1DRAFT_68315 [Neurospora tetrasperma FGSC 2508]EGZ68585.1 hypothetical protein NEUTE2DRAFT_118562 [Neurospora tetrasperma FGSC 2509]